MAITHSAAFNTSWLMVSDTSRTLAKAKAKKVVKVGQKTPVRNSLTAIPESLLSVRDDAAPFIESAVLSPTQNLSRWANGLTRLEAKRAPFGANQIEVLAAGQKVRSRVSLSTRIVSYPLVPRSSVQLLISDSFQCFTNINTGVDVTFLLPPARPDAIGLEFFFAVNPAAATGFLKIQTTRPRDSIQVRTVPLSTPGTASPVSNVDSVTASRTAGNERRTTVVLACRGVGLWVAENPAISIPVLGAQPVLLWTLGNIVQP